LDVDGSVDKLMKFVCRSSKVVGQIAPVCEKLIRFGVGGLVAEHWWMIPPPFVPLRPLSFCLLHEPFKIPNGGGNNSKLVAFLSGRPCGIVADAGRADGPPPEPILNFCCESVIAVGSGGSWLADWVARLGIVVNRFVVFDAVDPASSNES
jgi:hypothetical protein